MKKTISRLLTLQDLELQSSSNKRIAEVQALRADIPEMMLGRFDKFIVRGKKGVALVEKGVCKGCQISLPIGIVNELIQGVHAQVCGSCGRYLYLSETEAQGFQAGVRANAVVVKPKVPGLPSKKRRKAVQTTASENSIDTLNT